jgi:hypothetical protein
MSLTYDGVDELRKALEQVPAKASS